MAYYAPFSMPYHIVFICISYCAAAFLAYISCKFRSIGISHSFFVRKSDIRKLKFYVLPAMRAWNKIMFFYICAFLFFPDMASLKSWRACYIYFLVMECFRSLCRKFNRISFLATGSRIFVNLVHQHETNRFTR